MNYERIASRLREKIIKFLGEILDVLFLERSDQKVYVLI
jgi:hypothetical protein